MNAATHPVMNRPLPTGHINARDMPASDGSMNKALTQALEELREELQGFLTQHPDWFYGRFYDFQESIFVWHICHEWGGKSEGEYTPPNLTISFWKNGRTPIFKGRTLKASELDIPAHFMGNFLTRRPHLGCKTEVIEPWAITYHIFFKASKPRRG